MLETKNITIANFNCTFKVNNEIQPMLDFFTKMIYPAIHSNKFIRKSKAKNKRLTQYFLTDIKIIDLGSDNLALVGKHFKKVYLDIRQDINEDDFSIIPVGETKPSAPFSTFILLLKNHRLIHFPDQSGSPDIRSFASTFKDIIDQYRAEVYKNLSETLQESGFVYNNIKYKNITQFRQEFFNKEYPYPVINVVPIPSKELVSNRFKELDKIKSVSFKIYNQNNDIDFNPFFNSMRNFMNFTDSSSIDATLPSPKNIDVVEDAVKKSDGKSEYKIVGVTKSKEKITLKPDSLSETIPIQLSSDSTLDESVKYIYNKLNGRQEITHCSDDNIKTYNNQKDNIISFEVACRLKRK